MARHTPAPIDPYPCKSPALRLAAAARCDARLAGTIGAALVLLAGAPAHAAGGCDLSPAVIDFEMTETCNLSDGATLEVKEGGSIISPDGHGVLSNSRKTILNNGEIVGQSFHAGIRHQPGVSGPVTLESLTNGLSGKIEGGDGVSVSGFATITKLDNRGSITGRSGSAIFNEGTIAEIVNSGRIEGTGTDGIAIHNNGGVIDAITNKAGGALVGLGSFGYAIRNPLTAEIGKIDNSGEISNATGTAIANYGTIEEIRNAGTIRAGDPTQTAILNGGNAVITNGIVNSGLIDGRVELGSATLRLQGAKGRITGEVSGGANSAVVVDGTFTTQAGFFVDRVSVTQGGHLTIRQGHTIEVHEAAFENKGTVSVRAGETAYISGDYRQSGSGSLVIGAASASEHGKLLVKGTATFEPGAKVAVVVSKVNTLANGNVMGAMVEAGTLQATDDTFVVSDDSELFDFKATVKGNAVSLTAVLDEGPGEDTGGGEDTDDNSGGGSGGKGGAVSNRVIAQGFGQGLGAARVLDGFVANPNNTGDMADVVSAFGKLGSQAEVADAVAQTLPLMSANLNQVALGSMQGVNRVIQARQAGLGGMSSGDGFLADKHIWFKPLASYADQDDRGGVAGYRAATYGFLFGADAVVGKASRLGLAFSYARSDVDGKSTARGNRADIDAYQLIAYGSHGLAKWPGVEINWQADVGLNRNDGRRTIRFGGLDRTAESDFDSTTAHLGAGISRGWQLGERTRLAPALRADYFRIRNESYTEKGADALNLRVGAQTSEQLIAMLEGRLQHHLNERTVLAASLGAGYDVLGGHDSIAASYVGGGAAFRTPGMDAGRWLGRGGLGLSFQATEGTEITARYDVEGRSGFLAQTASVNVRWAF